MGHSITSNLSIYRRESLSGEMGKCNFETTGNFAYTAEFLAIGKGLNICMKAFV